MSEINISRNFLPQINKKTKILMQSYLHRMNVKQPIMDRVDADDLKPIQSEFDQEKVNAFKNNKFKKDPLIISNDDYIIDGHHRWKACEGKQVNVLRYDIPLLNLLTLIKSINNLGLVKEAAKIKTLKDKYR